MLCASDLRVLRLPEAPRHSRAEREQSSFRAKGRTLASGRKILRDKQQTFGDGTGKYFPMTVLAPPNELSPRPSRLAPEQRSEQIESAAAAKTKKKAKANFNEIRSDDRLS